MLNVARIVVIGCKGLVKLYILPVQKLAHSSAGWTLIVLQFCQSGVILQEAQVLCGDISSQKQLNHVQGEEDIILLTACLWNTEHKCMQVSAFIIDQRQVQLDVIHLPE